MLIISNEIRNAANNLSIKLKELQIEETKIIFTEVVKKFANNYDSTKLLWEDLKEHKSVNDKDSWMWIKNFVDSEAIMFFNPQQEKTSFLFLNGNDIVSILGESYAFEFYITNKKFEYFICFNHHDYLICSGSALSWIQQFIN